jgi:hypothetical protein
MSPTSLFPDDTNPKYAYVGGVPGFVGGTAPPKRKEAENDTLRGYDSFERNLNGAVFAALVTIEFVPG